MASISKRQDGSWIGQINKNGKRKSFYGKTKKEVEKKINGYLTDLNSYGTELEKTKITLSDLFKDYLFNSVKFRASKGTFERYMSLYNTHILNNEIGEQLIIEIRQKHIQNFFNSKNISHKSLNMIKYLLRQVFDYSIDNNLLRINPVRNIIIPKNDSSERSIEFLDITEQAAYISILPTTKYEMLFLTDLFTGLRFGEIIALKWDNVDLDVGSIKVAESYRYVKDYISEDITESIIDKKDPKTKNGFRTIPLPDFLKERLKEYQSITPSNKDNLVFANKDGNVIAHDTIRKIQNRLCETAKIKHVSFHALRHTYATRLIEQGVDVKTVSLLLGHANIKITLDNYIHSTYETKNAAATKLDSLYKSALKMQ